MLPPQKPGSISPPFEVPPVVRCTDCENAMPLPENSVYLQYTNSKIVCPTCGKHYTPWQIALKEIKEQFLSIYFYILGAKSTIFQTKVFLNSQMHFDLIAEGLPTDAIILDLNMTPEGMFAMEMSGNSRRQRNRSTKLQVYGFHTYTSSLPLAEEAILNIFVTWVKSSQTDIAWNNLVNAFDAYADGDFEAAVIPANVAVESKIYKFIEAELHGLASKERLDDFLQSAATYSYQLNILLPLLINHLGLPTLDGTIRGLLNALRDTRNDIAHRGHAKTPLTKDRTAELLAAALFGYRYIDYITTLLPLNRKS